MSSLEYHGHEWLARLEAGLRPVDLDPVNTRPPRPDRQASRLAEWRTR
jgi:hypothetical protein